MRLIDTYVTPGELTGYARAALADFDVNRFRLGDWLPSVTRDDLEYRFTLGSGGLTEAAEYRSWDTEAPLGSRPGLVRVSGELPPISRKLRLGEYDRLRRANLPAQIVAAIRNDARILAEQIAARVEMARASALRTGTVVINENGVVATVDFGRSALMDVTAGTVWTNLAALALTDLINWHQAYIDLNGGPAGAIVMPAQTRSLLTRNTEVKSHLGGLTVSPSRVDNTSLGAILGDFGIPPIQTFDAQVSVNGTATRLLPAREILFLPAAGQSDLGETQWGTTAEALEFGFTEEMPGIVSGSYKEEDPVAIWTKDAAIVLPVLANPNLTMRATVTA